MIIVSHLRPLSVKGLRSCDRSVYLWTLSTFWWGPLQEIDLGTITSGIVAANSSHQRSYHYRSRSIKDSFLVIVSRLRPLGVKGLRSCDRSVYLWTLSTFWWGHLQGIDLGTITSGIVAAGFSHQRSYHYRSRSIEEASIIIVSHLRPLSVKGLRSCDRSVCLWTLSTFWGGPLQEIVLKVITSGIITTDSSRRLSYHYHFGSIQGTSSDHQKIGKPPESQGPRKL